MLATLERVNILDQSEILAKMIVDSDIAADYRYYLHKMKICPETKRKVDRFLRLKDQYEEVQRFGRYHPDYKTVMKEIRIAKREMDLDENVANFKLAETALQNLLDEISILIGHSVTKNIIIDTGNPFFASGGSGCSTGGSCGCSH